MKINAFIPTILLTLTASITLLAQEKPLGEFAGQSDVGAPKLAGSGNYDAIKKEYVLAGAGTNIWSVSDQFHFVWKKMKGDFTLRAKVELLGAGTDPHRKIGLMIRPTLETDAPYADCALHGDGHVGLQFRRAQGKNTEQISLTLTNATVLQLERKGTTYKISATHDGQPIAAAQLPELDLGQEVYAGLFICSHNGNVREQAVFREVQIIPGDVK